jgi:hypothetical protein
MFPAEVDGWQRRQPARVFDPMEMYEVPIRMGFNTGVPGSPMSAGYSLGFGEAGIKPRRPAEPKKCVAVVVLRVQKGPALLKSA